MEASIKRLNNLLAKKLISPQVYDDGIAAMESAMTQQSAGLPTPDQPAVVTTPRVEPPATISPPVFDEAMSFGVPLDGATPVSMESLESSPWEVDFDWGWNQTPFDEIRDIEAVADTP